MWGSRASTRYADRKRKSKKLAPGEDGEGCEDRIHIIFQVQGDGEQEGADVQDVGGFG